MSRTRQPMGSSSFQTTTESSQDSTAHIPTLRLRAEETPTDTSEATSSSRRIRWSEDVVDNEGMGKKSSKVCCIYHKARPVGESSSEESSSSSSESDTESEDDRRTARVNGARHTHPHSGGRDAHGEHASHPDQGCCPEDHKSKPRRNRRKPSPNAYEKMPKSSRNQNQSQRHARGT